MSTARTTARAGRAAPSRGSRTMACTVASARPWTDAAGTGRATRGRDGTDNTGRGSRGRATLAGCLATPLRGGRPSIPPAPHGPCRRRGGGSDRPAAVPPQPREPPREAHNLSSYNWLQSNRDRGPAPPRGAPGTVLGFLYCQGRPDSDAMGRPTVLGTSRLGPVCHLNQLSWQILSTCPISGADLPR